MNRLIYSVPGGGGGGCVCMHGRADGFNGQGIGSTFSVSLSSHGESLIVWKGHEKQINCHSVSSRFTQQFVLLGGK